MKAGGKAKYEDYCKKMNNFMDEKKPPENDVFGLPGIYYKFYPEDDKITIKTLISQKADKNELGKLLDFSPGIKEALKDTDQFCKFKMVMGASAEEFLNSDKPILEHYLKGFSIETEVVFLKRIKKAINAALESAQLDEPVKEKMGMMLGMGGPAFGVTTNLTLDLTFDDMDELKAHPMAGQALVTTE